MTLHLSDLSQRRQEIARLVGKGWSYADIAAELPSLRTSRPHTISPSTVKMHVLAIAQQLEHDGVPPKVRVMLWARRQAA